MSADERTASRVVLGTREGSRRAPAKSLASTQATLGQLDSPAYIALQATRILALHWTRQTWTRRRTDRTTLHDERRVSWTSTFEIEVPEIRELTDEPPLKGPEVTIFPVVLKNKEVLTVFTLSRDGHQPVATLTTTERTKLTEELVIGCAGDALHAYFGRQTPLRPQLDDYLRRLAASDADAKKAASDLKSLEENAAPAFAKDHLQAVALFKHDLMRSILGEFQSNYLVLAPLSVAAGDRFVLEMQHDEMVDSDFNLSLAAGSAGAYHAEVRLQGGVRFRPNQPSVAFVGTDRDGNEVRGPELGEWRRESNSPELLALYAAAKRRDATLEVEVGKSLRTSAGGLDDRARQVGVLALAMFVGGLLLRLPSIHPTSGVAVSLLAIFPSVAAALALQNSPVPLHAKVAHKARDSLIAVLFVTLAGASLLSVSFPHGTAPLVGDIGWGWRGFGWAVATVLAGVALGWTYLHTDSDWGPGQWLRQIGT